MSSKRCPNEFWFGYPLARPRMVLTDRLVLRRWRQSDVPPYADICADPEVMRWIGDRSTRGPDDCARAIARFEQRWDESGFGLFAVELREARQLIGFVGFSVPEFLPEILPAIEIGWRLGRTHWGKGLATEAARAALDFAFRDVGLERIVSIHQTGNAASGRIMQKLGMTLMRETVDPTCGRSVRVYEITKSQWHS